MLINTDILIVGGGISGLHTAYQLQKRGIDFILVDARERLGGRILSKNYGLNDTYDSKKAAYDLGPSWFWPGQKNMEALVHELGLADSVFQQPGSDETIYEDQQGNIQKGFYGISMQGIYRMKAGIRQFISAFEEKITPESIKTSAVVNTLEYRDNGILTSLTENKSINNKSNYQITSNRVVIALPPRIAMSSIQFKPLLPESRVSELNSYATWMAGQAKIVAIYDKPFWLEQGLSGDAISQLGPLREIHDASPYHTESDESIHQQYALFGFIGVPADDRKGNESNIKKATVTQLVRMFGKDAANPSSLILKDWAQEIFTSTQADQINGRHASSSIIKTEESTFNNRLIW